MGVAIGVRVVAFVAAGSVTACAMTPQTFMHRRASMNNYEVCSSWIDAGRSANQQFEFMVADEARRRGLTAPQCISMVESERRKAAAVLTALLVVGAGVAMARSGGGGGGNAFAPSTTDYQWEWDLINAPNGTGAVWVCRGVQTAQFADLWRCGGKLQADTKWPGLGDPAGLAGFR